MNTIIKPDISKGEFVTALYKTGKYYGEVIDLHPGGGHYVVKILGVMKHPVQGDLHHPESVDVPLFHERKALSEYEKANIPIAYVKRYDGEIPGYESSLKNSLQSMKEELRTQNSDFSAKALETLVILEKETYKF